MDSFFHAVFNMVKEDLVQNDGPLNLHATNSRYRPSRLPSLSTQKSSLDDSGVNSYDDIQDMSFPEELSSLSRTSTSETSFTQYYYKPTSPTMDICNSDLSGGFANDNFSNSIPSTSSMFHHNDTNSYGLPDHSDEYLLNNLEINDNEKVTHLRRRKHIATSKYVINFSFNFQLVLTNEDYAMLTQGKQGSCLELILNNGEVLYAIIDPSDNDYNSSSPRITLVRKLRPFIRFTYNNYSRV